MLNHLVTFIIQNSLEDDLLEFLQKETARLGGSELDEQDIDDLKDDN